MRSRPESDEVLIERMLPGLNPDRTDRLRAWGEWQACTGRNSLLKFIRLYNNTGEADEDIWQEALLIAYQEVERGSYQVRAGVPFTAYVKGIARNKIREARRREQRLVPLEAASNLVQSSTSELEGLLERRERRETLWRGLSTLPTSRREVLERYLQGATTAQIACDLDISEALVRQHKHRGLHSLRYSLTPTD